MSKRRQESGAVAVEYRVRTQLSGVDIPERLFSKSEQRSDFESRRPRIRRRSPGH